MDAYPFTVFDFLLLLVLDEDEKFLVSFTTRLDTGIEVKC